MLPSRLTGRAVGPPIRFYTMSFLAGLQAIPRDLYEAARIDGADKWQEFWHITIPQLRNVFTMVVTLSTI